MDIQTVLFYLFAAIMVGSALRVITARNPVHSALFLVLTFCSAAAIWLMLAAEFLAITLVLVYVGAVMVLFLFVVMMLDINIDRLREGFWRNAPVALAVGVIVVLELAAVIWARLNKPLPPIEIEPGPGNTQQLGELLYTDYIYPVEIAAVILLVAIIAAIALTLRRRKDSRYNDPSAAVRTRASDRVRPVRMPAESRDGAEPPAAGPADASPRARQLTPRTPPMLSLAHHLTLGAILFAIGIVGIFMNRRNIIIVLMAIELMLLAVNLNFIAFSQHLGDMAGQIFVFFILTVAAAESAIGLAILVVLFRNLRSIDVEDLGSLKG